MNLEYAVSSRLKFFTEFAITYTDNDKNNEEVETCWTSPVRRCRNASDLPARQEWEQYGCVFQYRTKLAVE